MKIGLISDTHSFLDEEEVFPHFDSCDEIWHAGDFGTIGLADRLQAFRPLRGVYGNIDGQDIRKEYPEHLHFQCEDMRVWMTHIGGYPGRYTPKVRERMTLDPPDIFICGHSHILKVIYDNKHRCLHLNPGAAGKTGWHKTRTLLRFCITDKKIHTLEVIELGAR